jgi:hypothetical protein
MLCWRDQNHTLSDNSLDQSAGSVFSQSRLHRELIVIAAPGQLGRYTPCFDSQEGYRYEPICCLQLPGY